MSLYEKFAVQNEYYAAGLFENMEKSPLWRYSNALKRFWENAPLQPYDGGALYPCGKAPSKDAGTNMAVRPDYSYTFAVYDWDLYREHFQGECLEMMEEEMHLVPGFPTPHTIGGAGYTHSFINYERILKDGLCGYRKRVEELGAGEFKDAMLVLLDGIEIYRQRLLAELRTKENVYPGLLEAFARADQPPRTLYEALVVWNFVYYVDGCDDIGRLDYHLIRFWQGEDVTETLRELFRHVDCNDGWSGPLGPDYNELTLQCIRACHYIRRPSLQLRIKPDMPDEIWQEMYASLGTSCGQPALYNEEAFQAALEREFPGIPKEDRLRCCFGGCTETMLEGISNVGSDDLGIHAALIYDRFTRAHLAEFDTFEAYYDALVEEIHAETAKALDILTEYRKKRGQYRPQPVRTLLIDDCIDKQLDFNAGGARYYWSVSNVAGLINVIDSLSVLRSLVFEQKKYTPESFLAAMDGRDPVFLKEARACPCYGVDDDRIDLLAADLAGKIYDGFEQRKCWPSGKYLTVSNQFTTYEEAGKMVQATPDGRAACEPLCDSLGAINGKDTQGPTALLNSVAKLPLNRILGTPVMNIRIRKEHLALYLKPLVSAFFEKGGMQLQVSCLSREEMLDAIEHPERHENLVVRIGGYSEYFNRLSPGLQQTVLARTEY
ncbi:MAG: hypothetical protein IKC46_04240 [Lachnospiraceae bacterium]|nr:hypothetical protein [Lachnospiraceae bacterium]